MERKFVFRMNGDDVPNFKMCDMKFILETYDEIETLLQKTESPQHLIVKCVNNYANETDYWEVIEETF